MYKLRLPVPPVANTMYRKARNGVIYKDPRVAAYQKEVFYLAKKEGCKPLEGEIGLQIRWFRKEKKGDLDGRLKIVLDAFQGVCYRDDRQIAEIHAYRYDVVECPCIEVEIKEMGEA